MKKKTKNVIQFINNLHKYIVTNSSFAVAQPA